jgi:exodeoxyribonuclease VII large subunit
MNYTITQLYNDVKESLPNKKYTITAQISQTKLSNGHLYITLKDDTQTNDMKLFSGTQAKDNTSIIKAIIWRSKINDIEIKDGDKIMVEGTLDIYSTYGTINFIIDKVLENNGVGYLQIEYERIKKEFYGKGYFDKKLSLPNIIRKILILTSVNGAAIHDFLFNLQEHKANIEYIIQDVSVQGNDCPKSICKILDKKLDQNYDIIIITRGGGSYEDLFGFSNEILIESVYHFKKNKIPIISAIGHQVDNPLLDLVADKSCPTPSLASQFIIDHNRSYINKLLEYKKNTRNILLEKLYNEQNKLNNYNNILYNKFKEFNVKTIEIKNKIYNELESQKIKLKYFLDKLDNDIIFILDTNNNKISSPDNLKNGDYLLIWNSSKFKITIKDI